MKPKFFGFLFFIVWVAVFISLFFLMSCSGTKIVTVPEVHEIHHHHTDSIIRTDSVRDEKQTVIREVDSATMARYGIQLKQAERAWLVETNQLRREIERLQALQRDSVAERDSVPVPYPVEVVKDPSLGDRLWQYGISFVIAILVLVIIRLLVRKVH